jgi:hypothetical protein
MNGHCPMAGAAAATAPASPPPAPAMEEAFR